MKRFRVSVCHAAIGLGFAAALAGHLSAQTPLGTAFTYQGVLKGANGPVDGPVSIQFALFGAASGGQPIAWTPGMNVNVSDGLLTTPVDFGAGAFDGNARWMEIAVNNVALSPRQPIMPAPYALKVPGLDGNSLNAADGNPADAVYVDNAGKVGVGTITPGMSLEVTAQSYYNSPAIGVASGSHYLFMHGAAQHSLIWDQTAPLRFGTETSRESGYTERMRVTGDGRVGIGTAAPAGRLHVATPTTATSVEFEDYRNIAFVPASPWQSFTPTVSGNLSGIEIFVDRNSTGTITLPVTIRVGEGLSGAVIYSIVASIPAGNTTAWTSISGPANVTFNANQVYTLSIGSASGGTLNWYVNTNGDYPRGRANSGPGDDFPFSVAIAYAGPVAPSLVVTETGLVGIGTSNPTWPLVVEDDLNTELVIRTRDGGGNAWNLVSAGIHGAAEDFAFQIVDRSINRSRLTIFKNTGVVQVDALQIRGGADIAEPFEVGTNETVAPGLVVCIDPQNAGKLRLSTSAYDRTVAGVISGAGGVNPGVTLFQSDTLADGKHPVALSGRVYVYVDANAGGAVRPGDSLTTSEVPGHAMKSSDDGKSAGAIIGKAMTSLEHGKGLVLVLVNLH